MQTDTIPKTQVDWINWSKEIVEPDPVIIDFETRSTLSPRDHGSWKYSLDQSTEALCLSYQLYPGGEILRWNKKHTDPITSEIVIPESDLPYELFEAIRSGRLIEAHNVFFERAIWTNVMVARHGWPELVEENLRCSAARAAAASMPRALAKLGEAIPGLSEVKDAEGSRLMKQLMKPRKHTKDTTASFTEAFGPDKNTWPLLWWEDPAKHKRNWEYCDQDIRAERAVSDWLPHLSQFELKVWQLDQRMNLRGISCDTDLANQAIEIAAKMNGVYKEKCRELTGFSPGQRPKIREWLATNCTVDIPDTGRETLEREIKKCNDYVKLAKQGKLLADDAERILDRYPEALHAMNLIIKGNRTSVRKFNTMLKRCTPSDSRIRDIMLYCGAYRTGRWSGVGIQPHNYPRGSVKYIEYPHQMNEVCDHILSVDTEDLEEIEWLELEYGLEPVELMSGIARGALRAANDHILFAADFAAIEARAVFWLAGCESGLKMFRESDAGTGPEVYCAMASLIYGYAVNKKDHKVERQFGKQCLAGDTKVVTDHGLVEIKDIKAYHKLWDGVQWVTHKGLICQGTKKTMKVNGIRLTPDHKVMIQNGSMLEVSQALDENMQFPKLGSDMANLLSLAMPEGLGAEYGACTANAPAVTKENLIPIQYVWGNQHVVTYALNEKQMTPDGVKTRRPCLRAITGNAYWTDYPWQYKDAIILMPSHLPITEEEVYQYASYGEMIDRPFYSTLELSKDGTYQSLKWTEQTSTGITSPVIYDLLQDPKTCQIKDKSQKCSEKLIASEPKTLSYELVYDIANAGPRRRFTIACEDGSLWIVSNCILGLGFGMGFITFLLTCKKYKISFTKAQVKKIVDPESYAKLEKKIRIKLGGGRKLNRDTNKWERIKPDYNALDQLVKKDIEWKVVLHELILMQYTVKLYRSKFPEVSQFWNDCNDTAIAAMEDGVNRLHVNDKIWYQYDWAKEALLCGLPSGRKIYYQGAYLKPKTAPWGEVKQCIRYFEELGTARHWSRTHTYGGKLCENIVQATARDLMAYSMLVADQNGTYHILMSVHDELVCEARIGKGNVRDFEAIMTTLPPWAANDKDPFPVAAEAWEGQRYMKG